MVAVVVSLHIRFFDRAVHPLDLVIGLWMVWLGQAMLKTVRLADHVEPYLP